MSKGTTRSASRIALRVGLAVATAAIAVAAISQARSAGFGNGMAHATPWSTSAAGDALTSTFLRQMQVSGKVEHAEDWIARARGILRSDPLSVDALGVLGTSVAAADPSGKEAGPIFRLSERLSRRDLLTQLWLIEDAVTNNNIAKALVHYDRAISTHDEAYGVLFPVLTGALSEREVRVALAGYVRSDRAWIRPFLAHALENGKNPEDVADLLIRAGDAITTPKLRPFATSFVGRLVTEGKFASALALAKRLSPQALSLRGDLRFVDSNWDPALQPFTWTPIEDNMIRVDRDDEGKTVTLSVPPGRSGPALFRVVALPPGPYVFTQTVAFPDPENAAHGTWQIFCLRTGMPDRALLLQDLTQEHPGESRTPLTIEPECGAVRLTFVADGNDGARDASLALKSVALVPRAAASTPAP